MKIHVMLQMKSLKLGLIMALSSCIVLAACGGKGAKIIKDEDVITAFKNAGLEAENSSKMTKDDYGMAPYVCNGTRFLIPSLGEDSGGRIFVCDAKKDLDSLATYYNELGKASAIFYSWVFKQGDILVQINGDLEEAIARKYEQAIP